MSVITIGGEDFQILKSLDDVDPAVRNKTIEKIKDNQILLEAGIKDKNLQIRRTCEFLLLKYFSLLNNAEQIWCLPIHLRWEFDKDIALDYYNLADEYLYFNGTIVYGFNDEKCARLASFFYLQDYCRREGKDAALDVVKILFKNNEDLNSYAAMADYWFWDDAPIPIEERIKKW